MKRDWIFLLVAAGLAWGWVRSYGDRRASDALAEARRDSLETALASVESVTVRLETADSALEVHEAADRARLASSRAALAVASRRADSTASVLDSVLASLPDTSVLHIAITREREFGTVCKGTLDACTDLALTLTARVDTLTAERDLLRPALARTTEMWQAAEKRSKRRMRLAPCVGVGAAASTDATVRAAAFGGFCLSF